MEEFQCLLKHVLLLRGRLLIIGDFNIHVVLHNPHDTNAKGFLDLIDALGLQQHISGLTHSKGHILDVILT